MSAAGLSEIDKLAIKAVLEYPAPEPRRSISPAMLAAGRRAFKRKRKLIDDLWQAFDCDIDVAVRDIYLSMVRAAE